SINLAVARAPSGFLQLAISPAPTRTNVRSVECFFFAVTRVRLGLPLGGDVNVCALACIGARRVRRTSPPMHRLTNSFRLRMYLSIHLLHQKSRLPCCDA